MKKLFLSLTLFSFILFTPTFSQPERKPDAKPPKGREIQKLNLSDTQKKEFERLNSDLAKQEIAQQAKIKTAQIDLRQLMRSDAPEKAAIEKEIGEIADLEAQGKILKVDYWFAVNKTLTPDQQKVWKGRLDQSPAARMAMRLRQLRDRFFGRDHRGPTPPVDGPR